MKPDRLFLLGSLVILCGSLSVQSAVPIATTDGASNITSTGATLHGTVTPKSAKTKTWFEWGLTTNYGQVTATQTLAAGSAAVPVQQALSGLAPLTTYHFRTLAKNTYGVRRGTNVSFTTDGFPPTVITDIPTAITTNSAALNGTVNPNGLATSAYFEWGTTTNYGSATATQVLAAGSVAVPVQANLSSLVTDTPYHYRLVTSNAVGISRGSNVIVTPTLLLYLYAGESWTYVFHDLPLGGSGFGFSSYSDSRLSVLSNSFSIDGVVRFEMFNTSTNDAPAASSLVYSPSATGSVTTGGLFSVWSDRQGAVRLTVLTGSVVVSSVRFNNFVYQPGGFGVAHENTITPTRNPQPPSLRTQFVSSVSFDSAVIAADLNVRNLPTSVFVEWGSTTNYGFATGAAALDRDYFVTQQVTVSNLPLNAVTHLRVVATNSAGAIYGTDLVVTTPPPCLALTLPANNRRPTSASLNASVTANGFTTTAYFEWGTTTNYDQMTPLQNLGNPAAPTNVSAALTGLTPQSTYHYRAVAYALGVTNFGSDVVFSTTFTPTNPVILTNCVAEDVRSAIEDGGLVIFACDGVVALSNAIEIATDVSIDASGHSILFSGSNVTRIFRVLPGVVLTLTNITLGDGRSARGGAIHNEGTLLAQNCSFLRNSAIGTNGIDGTNALPGHTSCDFNLVTPGTAGQAGTSGEDAGGGAIYNMGTMNLSDCSFMHNSATAGNGGKGGNGGNGGVWYCSRVCTGGREGGNAAPAGEAGMARGGSIANLGTLFLSDCTFSNSFVLGGAGGGGGRGGERGCALTNGLNTNPALGGMAQGGAMYSTGNSFVSNSVFVSNAAIGGTGGAGAPYPHCCVSGGSGTNGGIAQGGAIYVANNSVIVDCALVANSTTGGEGGLGANSTRSGDGGQALGGAIAISSNSSVVNCVLVSNKATGGAGRTADVPFGGGFSGNGGSAFGGAIATVNDGAVFNCTLAMNSAVGGDGGAASVFPLTIFGGNGGHGFGGGLANFGTCAVTNLTLNSNSAAGGTATTNLQPGNSYGGTIANTGVIFQIVNSILSGGLSNNCFGVITDLGHNLSSDATPAWASGTSANNVDPLLLPLANNGGPTLTMALRAGSPALNSADCAFAPPTDQRGFPRPNGLGCDIGAYEGPGVPALFIARENNMTNVIRAVSEPGRSYRLEQTMTFNGWTSVATNSLPQNGFIEFRVRADQFTRFFRIVAE